MKHILLDLNVLVDYLDKRQPFFFQAERLIDLAFKKKIKLYLCASAIANGCYLFRKNPVAEVKQTFLPLLNWCMVLPMDAQVLQLALQSDFKDVEDAIVNFSAVVHGPKIQYLVTRNEKDFQNSQFQVVSPKEMLAII